MKGKIAIEISSPDRYKHNLEFLMATDPMQCKQKLNKIYHPAFCTLTSKPVMLSAKDKVIIKSPIAEMANFSAFVVNLNSKETGQSSGSLQTGPVTGYIDKDGVNSFGINFNIRPFFIGLLGLVIIVFSTIGLVLGLL